MPTQRRFMCLAAVAVGMLVATPATVLCDTPPTAAEPHRLIVFTPDRPERCDYFFVTEFNVAVTGLKSQDAMDRYLFTDALGLMRNVGRTRAVGASMDVHLTVGAIRFTPTVRFKQWLAGRQSIDMTLGYASNAVENEGVVGPIVDLRYSPNSWLHVQAGGCRIRRVGSIFYLPDYQVNADTQLQFYAGIGLGGVPAVVSWGVQAIGAAGLAVALSGMMAHG